MNPLEWQIKLNIATGETEIVKVQQGITVKAYFSSLHILNQRSHIYGVVYLANEKALELIK